MLGPISYRVVTRRTIFWLGVAAYPVGCSVTNSAVRDACTHGNCIHGWYSKYTTVQKRVAVAWAVGAPILLLLVNFGLEEWTGEARQARNRSMQLRAQQQEAARNRFIRTAATYVIAVARKQWKCARCGRSFDKGMSYRYETRWQRQFSYRIKYCEECCCGQLGQT